MPADSGDELAHRFAARAGAVDGQDGFEGFELLQPTDERSTWLVVTRWRDEESFEAWTASQSFAQGHAATAGQDTAAGEDTAAAQGAAGGDRQARKPVGMSAELWSFKPAGGSSGK